jgi:hypothetical protein
MFGPFLTDYVLGVEYLNPYWPRVPGFAPGKVLAHLVSAIHRECNSPECRMLSFMWGYGFPVLYKHENLHDVIHWRVGDLFGGVSVNFYRHVLKCRIPETPPSDSIRKIQNIALYLIIILNTPPTLRRRCSL